MQAVLDRIAGPVDFIYDPSLVLYLPLWKRDGLNFMSDDAYGHLCTVAGAKWTPRGRDFNPANPDYIEIPASTTQLDFTSGDFSIIVRVYIDDLSTDRMVFCRGLDNTDGYWFLPSSSGGGRLRFSTNQSGAKQESYSSGGSIATATWYTLGVSRSGTSALLYINGVEDTVVIGTHTNPLTSARTVKIGIYDNLSSNPFDGKIEFVAAWRRALNPMEQMNVHLAMKR